jgi:hypothetical protein
VVGLTAHFLDAPAGLASLTGLINLNTHEDGCGGPANWAGARVHWPGCSDRDDVISLMAGSRSRQNSYCSHASRWSYSSHVEQCMGNLRSASRLDSNGTRSCRNSLLLPQPSMSQAGQPTSPQQLPYTDGSTTQNGSSISDMDGSHWPPDYVVSYLHNTIECSMFFYSYVSRHIIFEFVQATDAGKLLSKLGN